MCLVMGPSGSGKTTLLSVLGCLLKPDTGTLHLHGQPLHRLAEKQLAAVRRQSIGFIFQSFRLFAALSALENVMIAMEIGGRDNKRTEAMRLLEAFDMASKHDRKPEQLSGGERQRVAIARALANDQAILLADEPTASLDHAAGVQVASILRDLAERQARLVVVVTHDSRLRSYAHRVLQMKEGVLEEDS